MTFTQFIGCCSRLLTFLEATEIEKKNRSAQLSWYSSKCQKKLLSRRSTIFNSFQFLRFVFQTAENSRVKYFKFSLFQIGLIFLWQMFTFEVVASKLKKELAHKMDWLFFDYQFFAHFADHSISITILWKFFLSLWELIGWKKKGCAWILWKWNR